MNKGSHNHYSLLLQDEVETEGIGIEEEEEEEEEAEDGLNVMEEVEEEEEEEEGEEEEPEEDSDEEEIFSSSKHRTLSHHESVNLNGQNHLGSEYHLLNNNDPDLKTVLDAPITIWTPTPMSPVRRACFIASIMFGILMVATFLWVLPCDVQPCEGELGIRDRDWAVKIEGMGINQTKLVRRLAGGHNVLLSYYTSSNISGWDSDNTSLSENESWEPGCINCGDGDGQCGLLMLDGNLGRENWRLSLRECPVDLQCDLLDVSGDHVPDCIVRGSHSMVFMVEARYGKIVWHLHDHVDITESSTLAEQPAAQPPQPLKLFNPGPAVLVPDVNNDSYGDLLFSGFLSAQNSHSWTSSFSNSDAWNSGTESQSKDARINNLILVNGQSGSVFGIPKPLKECQKILSVIWDGERISYDCLGIDGSEHKTKIHFTALLNEMLKAKAPVTEPPSTQHSASHIHLHLPPLRKRDPCQIRVHIRGPCPKCESNVHLYRTDGNVLWHRQYEHSGVVSWAALIFDGECYGALLKIWEWKEIATDVKSVKPLPQNNRRTTRSSYIDDEEKSAETEAKGKNDSFVVSIEINSASNNSSILNESNKITNTNYETVKKYIRDSSNEETIKSVEDVELDLQPPTPSESSRSRREFRHSVNKPLLYEHTTQHRHRDKQNGFIPEDEIDFEESISASRNFSQESEPELGSYEVQENYVDQPKRMSTTSKSTSTTSSTAFSSPFPTGMRTFIPHSLAPPGYQLQKFHERLVLLSYNGTIWHEKTLTSLGITQLCKKANSCVPDMKSHAASVAVTPGAEKNKWHLLTSSTTFVNTPVNGEEQHAAPWTLTSIVRKIIVNV